MTTRQNRYGWYVVVLILVALLPRVVGLGQFVTVDEGLHWFKRTEVFLKALQQQDWPATAIVGHPGVTTLWLGTAGRVVYQWLVAQAWLAPSELALRICLTLPIGLFSAAAVVAGFLLLQRLLPLPMAFLAALLWASEPFLISYARLLHLDSLLTSLMMLSLLAVLQPHRRDPQALATPAWLLISGVLAGLAWLTKSPSVLLVPLIGLALVVMLYPRYRTGAAWWQLDWLGLSGAILWRGTLWLAVAALTFVALWPAAWVDPLAAVRLIIHQAGSDGGSPHGWGNFFWGQALADPGPWFYLVALPLRLTPWTLLGVGLGVGWWLWQWRQAITLPADGLGLNRTLLLMLALAVGLVVVMSSGPKKFDRYILPVVPALCVIAAYGWVQLGARVASRVRVVSGGLFAGMLALNLVWFHPYYLAYYNQALGGGSVAAKLVPVGWGEGYEQAAAYIANRRDGADYPVAAWYPASLGPFAPAPAVPMVWARQPGKAGYAVLYIDQVQRRNEAATIDFLRSTYQPATTIWIHGIPYAEVYQLPRPVVVPLPAQFGDVINFRGYELNTTALRSSQVITLTVHWQAASTIPADYSLFVHVLDAQGQLLGQADVPPGGLRDPTSSWIAGQFVTAVHQVPVWGPITQVRWLAWGIYNPANGARLPIRGSQLPAGAPNAGGDAIVIPLSLP